MQNVTSAEFCSLLRSYFDCFVYFTFQNLPSFENFIFSDLRILIKSILKKEFTLKMNESIGILAEFVENLNAKFGNESNFDEIFFSPLEFLLLELASTDSNLKPLANFFCELKRGNQEIWMKMAVKCNLAVLKRCLSDGISDPANNLENFENNPENNFGNDPGNSLERFRFVTKILENFGANFEFKKNTDLMLNDEIGPEANLEFVLRQLMLKFEASATISQLLACCLILYKMKNKQYFGINVASLHKI